MAIIDKKEQLNLFSQNFAKDLEASGFPRIGLMIRDPYITEILCRQKCWELRSFSTKVRGRLGLIKSGSGHIFGEVLLATVLGPLSFDKLSKSWEIGPTDTLQLTAREALPYIDKQGNSKTYAWVFEDAICYQEPIPYTHPSGAITFVKLG